MVISNSKFVFDFFSTCYRDNLFCLVNDEDFLGEFPLYLVSHGFVYFFFLGSVDRG